MEFSILDEKEQTGNIIDILQRENELIRPAVANIDQALIVFAMADPDPNLNLLDRFLITMEAQGVPVVICRKVTRFTNNGWIGPDHPSKATEEWGKEMLQTTADYIADFMEELKKAPIEAEK